MGIQLIETIEVGSGGAASIEFTGIPQDGVDLVMLVSARTNGSTATHDLSLNSTSVTGLGKRLNGDSAGAQSYSGSYIPNNANTFTPLVFSNSSIYVSNYASTTDKSISIDAVSENNANASDQRGIMATIYSSASPVTSISISGFSSTFVQYTTASLYSIS